MYVSHVLNCRSLNCTVLTKIYTYVTNPLPNTISVFPEWSFCAYPNQSLLLWRQLVFLFYLPYINLAASSSFCKWNYVVCTLLHLTFLLRVMIVIFIKVFGVFESLFFIAKCYCIFVLFLMNSWVVFSSGLL